MLEDEVTMRTSSEYFNHLGKEGVLQQFVIILQKQKEVLVYQLVAVHADVDILAILPAPGQDLAELGPLLDHGQWYVLADRLLLQICNTVQGHALGDAAAARPQIIPTAVSSQGLKAGDLGCPVKGVGVPLVQVVKVDSFVK